jgi:hypothetical protein
MEEKKVAGSRIYTLIGIVIFSLLAYMMFMNNFNYIKMDAAKICTDQGGTWHAHTQECILEDNINRSKK